ncbi:lysophospholipid acyltransferase family protein [Paracoccus sp. (in: a-proteobacteria)]|uniref:lysophospholipid acyltransferase family protein n=1 Tax=Paracoccus sp. TaxID=267 RepID=UPI0028983A74|nr:lysophospholipid acyltransferase family protein [Paracoccus sp. (in: a-proteobacteria)]
MSDLSPPETMTEPRPENTPPHPASAGLLRRGAAWATSGAIRIFARLITAVQADWRGIAPIGGQRVYFANHNSHGDFILIWSVLPTQMRKHTRAVAGADYWGGKGLRRFIGSDVFNTVLIERVRDQRNTDPIQTMTAALDGGDSLIIFPEGTRNQSDDILLPFKSGIYHLASARPDIDLVPVWIDNLNRVMPKGEFVPVPLMCKTIFGAPLRLVAGESKDDFVNRARDALLDLRPNHLEMR